MSCKIRTAQHTDEFHAVSEKQNFVFVIHADIPGNSISPMTFNHDRELPEDRQ